MSLKPCNFIPYCEHVLLHVKIRNLLENFSGAIDYSTLSMMLLEAVRERSPKSIVIPVFTYSFTKKRSFSVTASLSEVGRFSEEIRKLYPATQRSLDPVFSVMDTGNNVFKGNEWNTEAFGESSIWKFWDDCDGVIVNIDLPQIVSTQLHFIEKAACVPYRYNKKFKGVVSSVAENNIILEYQYFVRNLEQNPKWDRKRIERTLHQEGVLHYALWEGLPVRWFKAKQMRQVLQPLIEQNPTYLLATGQ